MCWWRVERGCRVALVWTVDGGWWMMGWVWVGCLVRRRCRRLKCVDTGVERVAGLSERSRCRHTFGESWRLSDGGIEVDVPVKLRL